jgi:hypothetical protein
MSQSEQSYFLSGRMNQVASTGGVPVAIEGGRIEWEHQYIICGADQPDDAGVCVETGTAHMGDGAVCTGIDNASVLVAGVLSFFAAA